MRSRHRIALSVLLSYLKMNVFVSFEEDQLALGRQVLSYEVRYRLTTRDEAGRRFGRATRITRRCEGSQALTLPVNLPLNAISLLWRLIWRLIVSRAEQKPRRRQKRPSRACAIFQRQISRRASDRIGEQCLECRIDLQIAFLINFIVRQLCESRLHKRGPATAAKVEATSSCSTSFYASSIKISSSDHKVFMNYALQPRRLNTSLDCKEQYQWKLIPAVSSQMKQVQ